MHLTEHRLEALVEHLTSLVHDCEQDGIDALKLETESLFLCAWTASEEGMHDRILRLEYAEDMRMAL